MSATCLAPSSEWCSISSNTMERPLSLRLAHPSSLSALPSCFPELQTFVSSSFLHGEDLYRLDLAKGVRAEQTPSGYVPLASPRSAIRDLTPKVEMTSSPSKGSRSRKLVNDRFRPPLTAHHRAAQAPGTEAPGGQLNTHPLLIDT